MKRPFRATHPPLRPVLLFDGECGCCRFGVERWRQSAGEGVELLAAQDPVVNQRFPELQRGDLERSVHLIGCDGSIVFGAEAVFRVLAMDPDWRGWLRHYEASTTFAEATEAAYDFVARNRPFFSALARLGAGV